MEKISPQEVVTGEFLKKLEAFRPRLVIIRGMSGSGKSSLASTIRRHIDDLDTPEKNWFAVRAEADDYFTTAGGGYRFDFQELANAHKYCQLKARRYLRDPNYTVILSNTSTTYSDLRPYLQICQQLGIESVILLDPQNQWSQNPEVCFGMNIHEVPLETLRRQYARLQSNPIPMGIYSLDELYNLVF